MTMEPAGLWSKSLNWAHNNAEYGELPGSYIQAVTMTDGTTLFDQSMGYCTPAGST